MCCLHYAEKQRASNLWHQGPAPNAQRQTNQVGLPQSAERNSRGSGPDPRQERGLWPVPARTWSARPDLGSRAPLIRRWRILTIKERASACPGGIASAGRSWTPEERRLRALPPAQGRPSDPEDAGLFPGARGASSRFEPRSSAPSAQQGGPELERSWGSWRSSAARGRRRSSGRGEASFLRGSRGRAKACAPAVPKLRAGPGGRRVPSSRRTGRASAARPWRARRLPPRPGRTHWCSKLGPGSGLPCAHRPHQGAGRLCARGAPAAAASSGCCSRRRLPLLLRRRPLPAFPAGPEAAAESRSG